MSFNFILNFNLFLLPFLNFLYLFFRINFSNVKSFFSKKDKILRKSIFFKNNLNLNGYIKMQIILITISLILFFNYKSSNNYFSINNHSYYLLLLFNFLFIIFFKKNQINNMHWLMGVYLNLIISPLMLFLNDMLSIYIILELSAYIFIYVGVSQLFNLEKSQQISVVNSSLVSFILNFFSSILFFIVVFAYYFYEGSFLRGNFSFIFLLFFLIKVSLGPWLYISVDIYKGFSLSTLLVYTLFFSLVLLPKLISYIIILEFNKVLLVTPILTYFLFLLYTINTVNSLKVFLGYSTSITCLYILFIVLSIT